MNKISEGLKGETCNNVAANKATVYHNASPVLIIHFSQNSDDKSPC